MKAATIVDGELSAQERPDPEPGHGQILVRVKAAGINGADMLQRRGRYPAPPGYRRMYDAQGQQYYGNRGYAPQVYAPQQGYPRPYYQQY